MDKMKTLANLLDRYSFPEDAFFVHRIFQERKIIVYGAGESFHYFKEIVMAIYSYIPSVILDRRFGPGESFEGIPAFPPDQYTPSEHEKQHAVVVICLGNQSYFDDVARTLKQMGFIHIISLNDIYEIHNPFCLPHELEESGFRYYLRCRDHIEFCLNLFADDQSREIYIRCLQTHLQRKPVPIPMSPRHEQYTPEDVPLSRGFSRFVYCGVSVGDMATVFSRIGKVEELVCFEPDPNQYKLIVEYLSAHHDQIAHRITAIPCALFSREGVEPFTYSHTSFGSRILSSGEASIQAVTIDSILYGFKPTIITMDIEGAELEALQGAGNTIRENRPDLAICVYHSPAHLWEIPLYLHRLELGYRFYLRNYTSFVSETVLYAVSKF